MLPSPSTLRGCDVGNTPANPTIPANFFQLDSPREGTGEVGSPYNVGAETVANLVATGTLTVTGLSTLTGGATLGAAALTAGASTLGATTVTTLGTAGTVTLADGNNVVVGTTTGTQIGTGTTQLLGFYGATPIVRRAGAAQAAVVTTGSTSTLPFGYATAAQADAIVTLVNELRAWAVAQGFIKGAA